MNKLKRRIKQYTDKAAIGAVLHVLTFQVYQGISGDSIDSWSQQSQPATAESGYIHQRHMPCLAVKLKLEGNTNCENIYDAQL